MEEFYKLSKTKPISKEEIEKLCDNFKPLCECDFYFINGVRRFHKIDKLTIQEWIEIRKNYGDNQIYITRSTCQSASCRLLERNDKYCVWCPVF